MPGCSEYFTSVHSFYKQFLSVFCGISAESSVVDTEEPVPVLLACSLLSADTRTSAPGQRAGKVGEDQGERKLFPSRKLNPLPVGLRIESFIEYLLYTTPPGSHCFPPFFFFFFFFFFQPPPPSYLDSPRRGAGGATRAPPSLPPPGSPSFPPFFFFFFFFFLRATPAAYGDSQTRG